MVCMEDWQFQIAFAQRNKYCTQIYIYAWWCFQERYECSQNCARNLRTPVDGRWFCSICNGKWFWFFLHEENIQINRFNWFIQVWKHVSFYKPVSLQIVPIIHQLSKWVGNHVWLVFKLQLIVGNLRFISLAMTRGVYVFYLRKNSRFRCIMILR